MKKKVRSQPAEIQLAAMHGLVSRTCDMLGISSEDDISKLREYGSFLAHHRRVVRRHFEFTRDEVERSQRIVDLVEQISEEFNKI